MGRAAEKPVRHFPDVKGQSEIEQHHCPASNRITTMLNRDHRWQIANRFQPPRPDLEQRSQRRPKDKQRFPLKISSPRSDDQQTPRHASNHRQHTVNTNFLAQQRNRQEGYQQRRGKENGNSAGKTGASEAKNSTLSPDKAHATPNKLQNTDDDRPVTAAGQN